MNEFTNRVIPLLVGGLLRFLVQWIPLHFLTRWFLRRRTNPVPGQLRELRRRLIAPAIVFTIFAFAVQSGLLHQVMGLLGPGVPSKPYTFRPSHGVHG
jgi:hypothetical protein